MDDLNRGDIQQQYYQNIVMYKGDLVYVATVGDEAPVKLIVYRLIDNKRMSVAFTLKDFGPPVGRLGMVNVAGSVVYASRRPVRKMNIGISTGNLVVHHLPVEYPEGRDESLMAVKRLRSPEMAATMNGMFPTFQECLAYLKENRGAMAFDRQFAIDSDRRVFYRTNEVGNLPKNCTKPERIVFSKEYEHLNILIGDNCAKTLQPA